MKNNSALTIIFVAILFLVIGYILSKYINRGKVCYDLPTHNPDTTYWGPKYWKAIHNIADRIPCSLCRDDGIELFIFAHDLVNIKTGKPIFDENNFDEWLKKISEIKAEREKEKDQDTDEEDE